MPQDSVGSKATLDASIIPVGTSVSVKVPASSANLGPGYDSLGISLAYFDELRVTRISQGLEFELTGEGADVVPHDVTHLVVRAMQQCWAVLGIEELPGLRIVAHNRIPHSRGMGSSASAIVAGVAAANALLPVELRLNSQQLLQVCSDMEGHPDNVAPSLLGNFVISWGTAADWHSLPVSVHPQILPVVAIPDYEVSTQRARELIPAQLSHTDAARNSGRTALLSQALTTSPEYLFDATVDFLHQGFRAQAMAPSAALVDFLRSKGHAAVTSGAGPTVMIFAVGEDERRRVMEAIERAQHEPTIGSYKHQDLAWTVLPVNIDTEGVIVLEEESHR